MEIYLMERKIKKLSFNEKGDSKIRKIDLRSSSCLGPSLAKGGKEPEREIKAGAECTTRDEPGCEAGIEYTCNF